MGGGVGRGLEKCVEMWGKVRGNVGRGMGKCRGRCGEKCQVSVGGCEEVLREVCGRDMEKNGGGVGGSVE